MDPIRFLSRPMPSGDPWERDLIEIDAAIALVISGVATRVGLIGLSQPDSAVAVGLAHARQAHVEFTSDRDPLGMTMLTLGPSL